MANVKREGMTMTCPMCGELDASFDLDLANLMVKCQSCEDSCTAEVARDAIAAQLARWQAVVELVAHAAETFGAVLGEEADVKKSKMTAA
jgi:transcription elongation factor Elf1